MSDHRSPFQFDGMSSAESEHMLRASALFIRLLREQWNAQVPLLALTVAVADTLAEAGTYLLAADRLHNGSSGVSGQCLQEMLQMLGRYFEAQAALVVMEQDGEEKVH